MKNDSFASLMLVILDPPDGYEEEQELTDILNRMSTTPEDYDTADAFWNEYESALQEFSDRLFSNSDPEPLPFDDIEDDQFSDEDQTDDARGDVL